MFMYFHRASWHSLAALNEVCPFFFLSFKANANVKPAEMGHGPHSSQLCCSMYCFFCVVLCIVLCKYVLLMPPGGYQLQLTNIS